MIIKQFQEYQFNLFESNSFEAYLGNWESMEMVEISDRESELIVDKCNEVFSNWKNKKQLNIKRFKQSNWMYIEFGSPYLPNEHDLAITKYDDDWFRVYFRNWNALRYEIINYKCDQIEGVFDCLKHISKLINP